MGLLKKYTGIPLVLRIAIGLALGIALGVLIKPENGRVIILLGDVFIGSLKSLAPILVFVLIISSIAASIWKAR